MKVRSEDDWQGRLAAMAQDPNPMADRIAKFMPAWAEAAEDLMERITEARRGDRDVMHRDDPLEPMEALRRTLEEAMVKTGGELPVMVLGQVLLMLGSDWEPAATHKERFMASMNPIEQQLIREVARTWIGVLQAKAAENGQASQ